MNDLAIARALHVLAVVIWIGGVAMVTTIILPMVLRARTPREGQTLLEGVERRFIWQARIATLVVAASGFYIVDRLQLWDRFRSIEFWWMHAMVLLWLFWSGGRLAMGSTSASMSGFVHHAGQKSLTCTMDMRGLSPPPSIDHDRS
jgi:hypothetical protein